MCLRTSSAQYLCANTKISCQGHIAHGYKSVISFGSVSSRFTPCNITAVTPTWTLVVAELVWPLWAQRPGPLWRQWRSLEHSPAMAAECSWCTTFSAEAVGLLLPHCAYSLCSQATAVQWSIIITTYSYSIQVKSSWNFYSWSQKVRLLNLYLCMLCYDSFARYCPANNQLLLISLYAEFMHGDGLPTLSLVRCWSWPRTRWGCLWMHWVTPGVTKID